MSGSPPTSTTGRSRRRKLVILVQPWIKANGRPGIAGFEWRPQEGLKALIIDKDDLKKQRWAQADARAFYHTGAAWEESDGTIRLDVCFSRQPALGVGGGGVGDQGRVQAARRGIAAQR